VIKKKYGQDACNVGDEGGFAPSIQSNYEGVDLLMEAIKKAGYEKEVKIGMDVAASEFLTKDGKYDLDFKSPNNDGKMIQSGPELAATYRDLCKKYPIISVEDPFDQVRLQNCEHPVLRVVGGDAFSLTVE
jgi:enolase